MRTNPSGEQAPPAASPVLEGGARRACPSPCTATIPRARARGQKRSEVERILKRRALACVSGTDPDRDLAAEVFLTRAPSGWQRKARVCGGALVRTPFGGAVELDDLLEETRGSCPEVWAGRERSAIVRVERFQIETIDALDHEPRQLIRRQPIPQRRPHQERLLTVTFDEVLGHARNPIGPPGQNPFCDSHRGMRGRECAPPRTRIHDFAWRAPRLQPALQRPQGR